MTDFISSLADDTPLLMLPGTACDRRLFEPVIARLQGRRVIVADISGARTMPDLARKILADAPANFDLLGFSLGGIAALEIMAQAPQRVTRLALVDTTARPDPEVNAAPRRKAVLDAREKGMEGFILDAWERLVASGNVGDQALRETILKMARDCGPDRLAEQTEAAIHRADSRPRLTAIAVPTMVLAGEHEQLCPLDAHREIADGIPDAKFHVIKDAGHFAPLENPDAVVRHINNWLTVARSACHPISDTP
jgi:pimeloyl-ACP methyl ester carboxylesterase